MKLSEHELNQVRLAPIPAVTAPAAESGKEPNWVWTMRARHATNC
jgi:hypothetical protein